MSHGDDIVVPDLEVAVALLREMWPHLAHRTECLVAGGGGTEAFGIVLVLSHHRNRAVIHATKLAAASQAIGGGSIEVMDVDLSKGIANQLRPKPPSPN